MSRPRSLKIAPVMSEIAITRTPIWLRSIAVTWPTLPERDTIKQLGTKTVFVGDKKGHSTSKLIQKIRKRKFAE